MVSPWVGRYQPNSSGRMDFSCRRGLCRTIVAGSLQPAPDNPQPAHADPTIIRKQSRCRIPANRLKDGLAAPVAQLDRALPSEGKGHTFESCRVRQCLNLMYQRLISLMSDSRKLLRSAGHTLVTTEEFFNGNPTLS
ncbi:MAG: hypothetical protein JWP25_1999 [Bradyrhizobium sp.]|nr:hypothetical protein [Bradyrhizobium sp.]